MNDQILKLGNDINTDDIIPANRCTNNDPNHLAYYALEHVVGAGNVLNYNTIEAGRNFGCGSSREVAATALRSAGIRKIRAESFSEIFYRNSINIGLHLEIIDQEIQNPILNAIIEAGGLIPFNQRRLEKKVSLPKSSTPARPMTMAEKLLARASGNEYLQPGELIFSHVDLAMAHDATTGPVADIFYSNFGDTAKVWDSQRVVLVADHFIQIGDIRVDKNATLMYQQMIQFAQVQGCHLFDMVSQREATGICHVLLPEQGFIQPGMVIAGTDSHSCTYGAFGSFAIGVGSTDMANIFVMGDMWIRVPPTLLFKLDGILPEYVSAKDIMLFLLGQIGVEGARSMVMEFQGEVIDRLSVDERLTLCNMAIECGAMCGLIQPDQTTWNYLHQRPESVSCPGSLQGDPDAHYEKIYHFDLTNLEPQIARPSQPDQVVPASSLSDIAVTRAFIGSCTGGKLQDLAEAAAILKGRKVASTVDLF